MARKVRIEFQSAGFKEVLNSSALRSELRTRSERIAQAAGEGFEADSFTGGFGGGRVIGTVRATTRAARKAEAEDKALSRAIDAGR